MHRSHNQTGGWNIPLSALGGGEGRGEVGGAPPSPEQPSYPPHPPGAATPGPSLSPRKRAERGKGGGGRCPDLRRHPPHPPTLPARVPPSPPESGRRGGFRPVSAGNSLLQCSSSRTRLGGGIAVFRRRQRAIFSSRSRSIICVRMGEVGRRYGWSGGRLRGLPALPAPSLRASISLPAKTAGPLRFLLVKLLIGNGLWRCARRFFGCVLDFSPCSQGGSSLSLDRSRGASGPRAGRLPASLRGLPSA